MKAEIKPKKAEISGTIYDTTTTVVSLRGKGIIEVHEYLDQVLFKRANPKNIIIHTGLNDIKKLTIDEMENRF